VLCRTEVLHLLTSAQLSPAGHESSNQPPQKVSIQHIWQVIYGRTIEQPGQMEAIYQDAENTNRYGINVAFSNFREDWMAASALLKSVSV